MATDTRYRVHFVIDHDAEFEECNGENRSLTEAEYAENEYRGCPTHPRGSKAADTVKPGVPRQGVCACGLEYAPIPYAEYLAYYGNPEMHVYIGTIVERQTGVQDWETAEAVWNSDFMADDPALTVVSIWERDDDADGMTDRYYSVNEAQQLPGYFRELALTELQEAGWEVPT